MEYDQDVKNRAYELDPEAWVSYSGKPRWFKAMMEERRVATLHKAQAEYDDSVDPY